jgi:hypothetical protein
MTELAFEGLAMGIDVTPQKRESGLSPPSLNVDAANAWRNLFHGRRRRGIKKLSLH